MEANPSRRISQLRAATRSARAVFLCTAPLVGQPNAGLTGQGLRLATAEPGDQIAIFGEALRELTERATYRRFYGSIEIDMVRPVKSFDAILNAVVMELQRTQGAKVRLTLEIEAEAASGFEDSEVSVVRDNAKQLKFKPESTGFEE
jgi:hypothetical protein